MEFHKKLTISKMSLLEIYFSGLNISLSDGEQFHLHLHPILCSTDLIAKAQFLCMNQHKGKYVCKDCLTKGSLIPSGKGYAHCYSYDDL